MTHDVINNQAQTLQADEILLARDVRRVMGDLKSWNTIKEKATEEEFKNIKTGTIIREIYAEKTTNPRARPDDPRYLSTPDGLYLFKAAPWIVAFVNEESWSFECRRMTRQDKMGGANLTAAHLAQFLRVLYPNGKNNLNAHNFPVVNVEWCEDSNAGDEMSVIKMTESRTIRATKGIQAYGGLTPSSTRVFLISCSKLVSEKLLAAQAEPDAVYATDAVTEAPAVAGYHVSGTQDTTAVQAKTEFEVEQPLLRNATAAVGYNHEPDIQDAASAYQGCDGVELKPKVEVEHPFITEKREHDPILITDQELLVNTTTIEHHSDRQFRDESSLSLPDNCIPDAAEARIQAKRMIGASYRPNALEDIEMHGVPEEASPLAIAPYIGSVMVAKSVTTGQDDFSDKEQVPATKRRPQKPKTIGRTILASLEDMSIEAYYKVALTAVEVNLAWGSFIHCREEFKALNQDTRTAADLARHRQLRNDVRRLELELLSMQQEQKKIEAHQLVASRILENPPEGCNWDQIAPAVGML
jgi:hypothetical protein